MDLIGPNSCHNFSQFFDVEWLSLHPKKWHGDKGFKNMFKVVRNSKVVKDVPDRGEKLVSELVLILRKMKNKNSAYIRQLKSPDYL